MGCLPANGPAIHELERAESVPVLGQQMLAECLSFLSALLKFHCGSPHVFINEAIKGSETGSTVSQKQAHTIVLEPLCCRFVVAP
jgi:hypothetical protein